MIFALAGNQNCGKTTLFNQLTGSNQHVGNFPGVTVDQKSGPVRGQKDCTVVDLPGIYSLRPYTAEEIVTRDFILKNKPDGIINIVDATNLERNLYLTLQLLTLRVPTVLALNKDGTYQLQAGIMKVNAKPDEVYLLENETKTKAKKIIEGKVRELKSAAQPELDLRGMAADEAIILLDNFLDSAYMGNLPTARIIHGKGTGVLRAAVHDELRRCKYVKSFRLGVYGEGESGVTIVEFK